MLLLLAAWFWPPLSSAQAQVGIFTSTCAEDNSIAPSKRAQIDAAALFFIDTLRGSDPGGALDLLTKEAREVSIREQLSQFVEAMVRPYSLKNFAVQHRYLVHITGEPALRVICGKLADNAWQSVAVVSVPEQAYAVISAEGINNSFAVTLWLIPQEGKWKVQSFWMNLATLADRSPEDLLQLARLEKRHGHNFNAALLYAAASQLVNRGPNFQLGIENDIVAEGSRVTLPVGLAGNPPFELVEGTSTFKVLSYGPIAVGGKIYLAVAHEVAPWSKDEEVDARNKQLMAYFKHRFAEYSDVFAGIVIRAHERGTGRGFGTVEETK
ncbi:MAG: hypothetical protein L0Z53_09355 [Acidobacteriales bacterium]|nr:hypothetical protein [Terriglobales bacterium]